MQKSENTIRLKTQVVLVIIEPTDLIATALTFISDITNKVSSD